LETSDGTWRSEAQWPPADASSLTTALKSGSYTDDAQNNGTAEGGTPNGQGIWTFSPPLAHDAHLAGVPRVSVNASITLPDANLVADVYDVDSVGRATLISRGTYLLPGSGQVGFDLYGDDWKLPAGHRVGVLLTSSNAEWWLHRPTLQPVTVGSASISLPWRSCEGGAPIEGGPSIKLDSYRADAPFTIAAATDHRSRCPARCPRAHEAEAQAPNLPAGATGRPAGAPVAVRPRSLLALARARGSEIARRPACAARSACARRSARPGQ